ncbi:hypothetical protein MLD38_008288 [Melastoma candidum]|uniref:Uncharacterized protein n=1 Tax=Melastoma candidum TaxID=119954 RepID=A0ACB9RXJ3_9MYRT|nr:hypothetical protein MLD38_008288 [Melastoma candidum]
MSLHELTRITRVTLMTALSALPEHPCSMPTRKHICIDEEVIILPSAVATLTGQSLVVDFSSLLAQIHGMESPFGGFS